MSDRKKEAMFAKLAEQSAKAAERHAEPTEVAPSPSPALPSEPAPKARAAKKPAETVRGKRDHPEYRQANCYLPIKLRRDVDRAMLDLDGLDFSTLVEGLLRNWLESPRIPK